MSNISNQNPPDAQAIAPSRRSWWKLIGLGTLPLGVGIFFIQTPISCACGNPAFPIVGVFARAQQAYFLEYKTLGKTFSDLLLGDLAKINQTAKRYEYSYEVLDDRAYMYAKPSEVPTDLFRLGLTKAEIGGVVSAIAIDRRTETAITITCYAVKGTSGKPPQPQLVGGDLVCPEGYQKRQ
jgi:hypothetical protein